MAKKKFGFGDVLRGGRTAPKPTKPKKPGATRPPYGSYDPALDQQERAAGRGLGDLIDDIARGNLRSSQDYELGKQGVERQSGRSLSDLLRDRERGIQDYNQNLTGLQRQYTQLGSNQRQAFAASGNMGGAAIQAARKRAENQAIDRQPLDQNYERFMDDSKTAETRLGEDTSLALGDLALGYTRGYEDTNLVQLPRAQRENLIFGQDINETRIDQAKQAGLLPAGFGSQNSGVKPGPAQRFRASQRRTNASARRATRRSRRVV